MRRRTPSKGSSLVHARESLASQRTIDVKLIHEGIHRRWLIQRRSVNYTILKLIERLGTR